MVGESLRRDAEKEAAVSAGEQYRQRRDAQYRGRERASVAAARASHEHGRAAGNAARRQPRGAAGPVQHSC